MTARGLPCPHPIPKLTHFREHEGAIAAANADLIRHAAQRRAGSAARQSRNQTCFVGAGLVPALRKGTHEGCPYERRKMFP